MSAKKRARDEGESLFGPLGMVEPGEDRRDGGMKDFSPEQEPLKRLGSKNGVMVGTAAFARAGEAGDLYPKGAKPGAYIRHYSRVFPTVEIDSTFYATPAATTVRGWYEKTPQDFVFAAKVPRVITHDKVLVDCDEEFSQFVNSMEVLDEKLGPMLLQFGFFNRNIFRDGREFLRRLEPFLKNLPAGHRFAVEIRNKGWLDERFIDVLRENRVALALIDQSWVPRPWEMKDLGMDLVTTDFAYVRWLGDRKGIEEMTTTWDKTIVDRREDMLEWVKIFKDLVRRNLKVYAYANNHYAGNGPGTVKLFWDLFEEDRNTGERVR